MTIVFILASGEEKGYFRVVSVGHLIFDCRMHCGLSRRILLHSNNFTKRGQNGFQIGTRNKFSLRHVRGRKILVQMRKLFTHFSLQTVIFPYNSLYTQAVAYTTYFELGEPVVSPVLASKILKGQPISLRLQFSRASSL